MLRWLVCVGCGLFVFGASLGSAGRDDGAIDAQSMDAVAQASYRFLQPLSRWFEPDLGKSIPVDVRGEHPSVTGGVVADVLDAIERWNGVADTPLRLSLGRVLPRAACPETRALGRITISFGDPCRVILDGTPAIGGFSQPDTSMTREIGGSRFARIVDGYIMFDDGKQSSRFIGADRACFRDVLIHEIGHALGFDHSDGSGSVMKVPVDPIGPANPCRSGQVRDLGADDRAAIRFLYTPATPPLLPELRRLP